MNYICDDIVSKPLTKSQRKKLMVWFTKVMKPLLKKGIVKIGSFKFRLKDLKKF